MSGPCTGASSLPIAFAFDRDLMGVVRQSIDGACVARLDGVEVTEAEIVDEQYIGCDEFSQNPAGARVRAGLVELTEEVIDAEQKDFPPGPVGGVDALPVEEVWDFRERQRPVTR